MSLEWKQGTVVAIPAPGRVRVRLGATASSEVEMPKEASYTPAIGQVVQFLQDGARMFAIGVAG